MIQPRHCWKFVFNGKKERWLWRDNPAASEFRYSYRMVMVAELIKPALSSNCAHDTDQCMLTLSSLSKRKYSKHNNLCMYSSLCMYMYMPVTESALILHEKNTMAYIAGYSCHKMLMAHDAVTQSDKCKSALLSFNAVLDDPSLLFTHNKAWDTKSSDFGSLEVPLDSFLELCTVCEQIFRAEFNDICMTCNRISYLIKDQN